jgi:hypothetical protein
MWDDAESRLPDDRTRHGRHGVPVNPYPEPELRLADREGYPFAVSQAELVKVIPSPEEDALSAEYGPRG